jgi:hypothetical protein
MFETGVKGIVSELYFFLVVHILSFQRVDSMAPDMIGQVRYLLEIAIQFLFNFFEPLHWIFSEANLIVFSNRDDRED